MLATHRLPLLCHNVVVYHGPLVPTKGLHGHIHADGLQEDDELVLLGMTPVGRLAELGKLTTEVEAVIFNPRLYEWVKAIRSKSSGNPVTVWVA